MTVLIVDDEENLRASLAEYLSLESIPCRGAGDAMEAMRILETEPFDAAVVDLKMPKMTGIEFLQWMKTSGPDIPIIMISAHGEIRDAVDAMRLGAYDYLVKPFEPEELVLKLRKAVREKRLSGKAEAGKLAERAGSGAFRSWIGESPAIREAKRIAEKASMAPSTVLITGESGTGKEIAAKTIHELSPRSDGPFIPVNLGGFPENLLESELFGFEKGAFTGAESRKLGIFELAQGGTLFLDEIGEMPVHLQVKLLRVIQEKKIMRLGGTRLIPIDVRLIAATNRDLEERVREGSFREDFYFRLNVIRLRLPPLREREGDIALLSGYFLKKLGIELGKPMKGLSEDAYELLGSYPFPGNIRELENAIERAIILSESDFLRRKDFQFFALRDDPKPVGESSAGTMRDLERRAIADALTKYGGHREKTAAALGISRRTLLNKMKEYSIPRNVRSE